MFELSHSIWLTGNTDTDKACEDLKRKADDLKNVTDHKQILKAARTARSAAGASEKEDATGLHLRRNDTDANVRQLQQVTSDLVYRWLQSPEVNEDLNAKQLEMIQLVADRILVECGAIQPEATIHKRPDEPLVWLLHGPPGTGKTHVLQKLRKLFDLIGYTYSLEYEVMAFQGANAADIDGKTIHSACGLSMDIFTLDQETSQATAKRIANWRWIIIDEIGMVSARLAAQAELRLRQAMPSANRWKNDNQGPCDPSRAST